MLTKRLSLIVKLKEIFDFFTICTLTSQPVLSEDGLLYGQLISPKKKGGKKKKKKPHGAESPFLRKPIIKKQRSRTQRPIDSTHFPITVME